MCEITATEFKTNFGKYLELAQKEQIVVTVRGKPFVKISSFNDDLVNGWLDLFGSVPREAFFDKDIDREWLAKYFSIPMWLLML